MTINVTKYRLNPDRIFAGTRGSFGMEKLSFDFGDGWDFDTISVTFHPQRGKPIKVPILPGTEIDIPAEVMEHSGESRFVVSGRAVGEDGTIERQAITLEGYVDVAYTADEKGGNTRKVTPDMYDQLIDRASKIFDEAREDVSRLATEADESASDAEGFANSAEEDADSAEKSASAAETAEQAASKSAGEAKTAADTAAGAALNAAQSADDATSAASAAKASATAAENSRKSVEQIAEGIPETVQNALQEAKDSGEFDGEDGITPHIGENENWYIGNKDTGVRAKGKSGVHVGSAAPPVGTRVWVKPDGKRTKIPQIDDTLTKAGYAADAAKVGDKINQLSAEIANMQVGNKTAFDTFIDNVDVDYAYDETTGAYYTVIRIYRDRVDGKKQYPFVYAPNGYGAGDKTTYDISTAEGWCLAINSGIFDMTTKKPDGILIQNGVVLKNSPSATHLLCKPLTIDSNGNLGYAAYDADAEQLAKSGIVSAVCGFMPIVVNYEAVPDTEWNSVGHYTDNAQRQIVGQWGCGDYAIITCEGRGKHNSDGWTIAEAQAICIKHGLKFAYNLDGGGSTETMLGLKHINTIYEGTTGRIVPTFIVFNGTDDLGIVVDPDEGVSYTTLEYVQFTGTQYITTDVPESTTFGAEAELSLDSLTNTTGKHFLSAPNSYVISTTMDYPLVKRCGGWETTPYVKDNPDTSLRLAVDTVYTVSAFVNSNTYKWGNYEIKKYADDTVSGNYVIGCWAGALNTRNLPCKLYSLKFYDSGVLTHNFVPSMRNDGAVGLLETMENRFYESATSTALVAGSAVS